MLLDEPFGGLDAITRAKMHEWLLSVLDKLKTSVMFITHDVEEAILLSDRIYILSDKPAIINKTLSIDLKKPRHKDIITKKEFIEIKKNILKLLAPQLT
jgi:ABC-type nitrate/sulfonate/bicarbonate transport system ATPase subunit